MIRLFDTHNVRKQMELKGISHTADVNLMESTKKQSVKNNDVGE